MTAKDPHLVKTPIDKTSTHKTSIDETTDKPSVDAQDANRYGANQNGVVDANEDPALNAQTEVNKGTESLETANTEHVDVSDDPARQPDRRDQQGETPFDEGVNERTMGQGEEKSDDISDQNRYANIDNAQKRVLNVDERDSE